MNVYYCTDHAGHYVGVASVIVAKDEEEAREVLDAELVAQGLAPYSHEPYTLKVLSLNEPVAVVLQDGDY